MNIYQKLLEVRKTVPYLQKTASGAQYKYTGSSQVLSSVREKLDELGLVLITRITDSKLTSEANSKGTTVNMTELTLEFTWVNTEKPEEAIVIPFYAQGVDLAGEKGVGKALTYGEKYFILKQFNIATDQDDPDAFQKKVEQSKPPKLITEKQVGDLKTKALKFANLRGGTEIATLKALKIKDIDNINEIEFNQHMKQLDVWISKVEKDSK